MHFHRVWARRRLAIRLEAHTSRSTSPGGREQQIAREVAAQRIAYSVCFISVPGGVWRGGCGSGRPAGIGVIDDIVMSWRCLALKVFE